VAAGLAGAPLLDGPLPVVLGLAGVAALGSLAAALAGWWADGVGVALVLLVAEYGGSLVARGPGLDPSAPLVAAGLLLAAELAYWSADVRAARAGGAEDRALTGRRARRVAVVTLSAAAGASFLLAAAALPRNGGEALRVAGVAAAAAAATVVLALLRRVR
jgi:hypothetical protein